MLSGGMIGSVMDEAFLSVSLALERQKSAALRATAKQKTRTLDNDGRLFGQEI
jgi:hypothetical protein